MKLNLNSPITFAANSPNQTPKAPQVKPIKEKQPEAPKRVKLAVLASTIAGVITSLAIILKRGGYPINPAKAFKGPIKSWGVSKVEYDWKEVIILASGSISGGIVGGMVSDKKENIKAKLREGLVQMLGNILTPLGCVKGGMELYKHKIQDNLLRKLNILTTEGLPHSDGKKGKLLKVIATAICLTTGILAGNKVSNLLNEEVYHIKDDRGVKFADMSGHLDDTCLATAIAFGDDNMFGKVASRIIPLALLVCGYSSGVMQEWPEDKKAQRTVEHKLKK